MYSFSSTVRYSECDTNLQLTVPALINYLQDCSTFHTESVGHGVRYSAEHNFGWYIAAWQIHILQMPRFTQPISVSTWCNAMRPTMANRSFMVCDEKDNVLVKADSLWFVYDTQLNRPVRIPEEEYVYLTDDAPIDLPPIKRKVRVTGEGETMPSLVVTEHHLDTNHHVNNAQYVNMADTVVRSREEDFDLARLFVQYKQMAHLGDVIVPHLHVEPTGYAVDLADESGESYAVVRMERRA